MQDELALVLQELGTGGLNAFYFHTILEYTTVWIMFGLIAWGIQTVWKKHKDDL